MKVEIEEDQILAIETVAGFLAGQHFDPMLEEAGRNLLDMIATWRAEASEMVELHFCLHSTEALAWALENHGIMLTSNMHPTDQADAIRMINSGDAKKVACDRGMAYGWRPKHDCVVTFSPIFPQDEALREQARLRGVGHETVRLSWTT